MALTKKEIADVKAFLAQVEEGHAMLEGLADKYREAYDAKSDKWKEGDKGEEADTQATNLETLRDNAETLKDSFDEIEGIND